MLRAAIMFFVLAILSMVFGLYGIAGLSLTIGKLMLVVFLAMALISFIGSLVSGKNLHLPK